MRIPQAQIRFAAVLLFVVLSMNFIPPKLYAPARMETSELPATCKALRRKNYRPLLAGAQWSQGNGINYHTGGTVLKANPVPIYIIWYGNWNGGAKPSDSLVTRTLIEGFPEQQLSGRLQL